MKLSVVIVNYNVKFFLEQCLYSIFRSSTTYSYEVIVVDNASSDDSVGHIRNTFPQVKILENSENLGFSKANNQGAAIAQGHYLLILNPDTIVQEDSLDICIKQMDNNPEIGALGIRMIDGTGKYLPESKRGFPTIWSSLSKMIGLYRLFPNSKWLNQYYLGHLSQEEDADIDTLTGAFLMTPKSCFDELGGLDESFFMYGEDIDYCYRVKQKGLRVLYSPRSTIVHFKGESTKKQSITYLKNFYNAMAIYAKKHYGQKMAKYFLYLLELAIFLKGVSQFFTTLLKKIALPLVHMVLVIVIFHLVKFLWANYYYHDPDYFIQSRITTNIILYALIWVSSFYIQGVYDELNRWRRWWRACLLATLLTIILYAFLSFGLRPSRAVLLLGNLGAIFFLFIVKIVENLILFGKTYLRKSAGKTYLIVGKVINAQRLVKGLEINKPTLKYAGVVNPEEFSSEGNYIGSLDDLDQIVLFNNINEIIFCASDISHKKILDWMARLNEKVQFKIAPENQRNIIGSSSKNLPGELYTVDVNFRLSEKYVLRQKRLLDIILGLLFFLLYPGIQFFVNQKGIFFTHILQVLANKKTWVGFVEGYINPVSHLKLGVVPCIRLPLTLHQDNQIESANIFYARDYRIYMDIYFVFINFEYLGNRE